MTANYLVSDSQKEILAAIRAADPTAPDHFARAPFVIDAREDAGTFKTLVSESQLRRIEQGSFRFVSELPRPACDYAREQVRIRYRALDSEALKEVRAFLDDWRLQNGRQPHHTSRNDADMQAYGIEIILPISGLRLAYDLGSLTGL